MAIHEGVVGVRTRTAVVVSGVSRLAVAALRMKMSVAGIVCVGRGAWRGSGAKCGAATATQRFGVARPVRRLRVECV